MFRLTIRDVLWLMVLTALGLSWWLERRRANYLDGNNVYLREAIDRAGFIPDGDYIGPNLSRKNEKKSYDAKVIKMLADENASLKEQIELAVRNSDATP